MTVTLCPGSLPPIEKESLKSLNPFYSPAALRFSSLEEKQISRRGEVRTLAEVSRVLQMHSLP